VDKLRANSIVLLSIVSGFVERSFDDGKFSIGGRRRAIWEE